jgi:hypothetical protein
MTGRFAPLRKSHPPSCHDSITPSGGWLRHRRRINNAPLMHQFCSGSFQP